MSHPDWLGPSVTALGLAAARAVESGRADRLIDDPLARALFTSAGVELPMRLQWPAEREPVSAVEALHLHGSRYIGLRTRLYDDLLLAASEAGLRQAVLLGAGLDTRAYRLALPPDFAIFELDQAGVLEYKDRVLSGEGARPRCGRTAVAVDLRDDWPARLEMDRLLAAGEALDVQAALAPLGWDVIAEAATQVAQRYGRDLANPFSHRQASADPPWLETTFVCAVRTRR